MSEDSLKKRYLYKLVSSGFNAIANVIFLAIVPSALGPAAYGQFTYLQQFFIQVVGFLDAGTSIAFFTKLSANRERSALITFYLIYVLFILLLMLSFFYMVDVFSFTKVILPEIDQSYVYLAIYFGFLTWLAQVFLKISDAFVLTTSVEVIKTIVKLFSVLTLVYIVNFFDLDLYGYFYFQNFSLLIFILASSFFFFKKRVLRTQLLSLKIGFKRLVQEFYIFCSPLFVYKLVGLFVGLFDIWLLQQTSGSVQTGFYGLALSIVAISFLFTSSMTPLITREFSTAFAESDLDRVRILFSKYIPMFFALAAFIGIFIAFQVQNVLESFTDERFYDAYWVLVVMAFYPLHQTYGQLSGAVFYASEQTKLYRNIGLFAMLIGGMVSFALIYYFQLGALGLAIKMVLTQFVGVTIQLYFNCRLLQLNIMDFIRHQLYIIVLFSMVGFVVSSLINESLPFTDLMISAIIYFILTFVIFYIYPKVFSVTRAELDKFILQFKTRVFR